MKLDLLLDHDGYLPTFASITEGRVHDVKFAQGLKLPPGSIVAMARGYYHFELFDRWTTEKVWFVSRLKSNANYYVGKENPVPGNGLILADEVIRFARPHRGEERPASAASNSGVGGGERRDELITNHHGLAARTIAAIYKERWQIELFFNAIKQNLKIKTFVGTSANALHIQICTELIAILLVKNVQFRSQLKGAVSNLVALLQLNLFTYRDLSAWIDNPYGTPPGNADWIQMPLPGL